MECKTDQVFRPIKLLFASRKSSRRPSGCDFSLHPRPMTSLASASPSATGPADHDSFWGERTPPTPQSASAGAGGMRGSVLGGTTVVCGFLTSTPAHTECRRNADLSGPCLAIRNLPQGGEARLPPCVILFLLDGFFQSGRTARGPVGRGLPVLPASTLPCRRVINGPLLPPLALNPP